MPIHSILFLLGIIVATFVIRIKTAMVILAIFCCGLFFLKFKTTRFATFFLIGVCWVSLYSIQRLSCQFPSNLEGVSIQTIGYIDSIPAVLQNETKFNYRLQSVNSKPACGITKLSWRDGLTPLKVGDKWQFTVRMKRIHGLSNPGSMDYDAWAFQQGIVAQGYVFHQQANRLKTDAHTSYVINRLRQRILENIRELIPEAKNLPWITALVIGERQGASQDNWDILRNTGTNHLMAIAGLHIGIMSGIAFVVFSWLWRRYSRLVLLFPAHYVGAIAALCAALLYAMLAGFSLPTERAVMMVACFLVAIVLNRVMIVWNVFAWALFLILIINPLVVTAENFWLSFGTVAIIIYGMSGRLNPAGLWWKHGRIQWIISFGLLPLSFWLFYQYSFVSLFANAIAIPWTGFIILPTVFFGCAFMSVSQALARYIFSFADINLTFLFHVLSYLSHFSWAVWYKSFSGYWIVALCMAAFLLLLPKGFPGKWLGLVFALPLFVIQRDHFEYGDVKFTLLDVGQGLSAIVQTKNHVLVFDAGAKFNAEYDMGSSVVVPFLQYYSQRKVDIIIISHGDNDHIGGLASVLNRMDVIEVKSSVPEKINFVNKSLCLANQSWEWDGVLFEFLYPSRENLSLNNDSSCVLKITSHDKSILLTGDIEKSAETYLVAHAQSDLASTILVAPHHGSKTSAEDSFIDAVHPQYVLFPVGYRNRYHFPHVTVIEKYQARHVQMLDTVNSGAMQFYITKNGVTNFVNRYSPFSR